MLCCETPQQDKYTEINSTEDFQNEKEKQKAKEYQNSKQYKKQLIHEQKILEQTGLKLGIDLELKNIYLDKNQTQWIHTAICGKQSKENKKIPYVLIHGYGHSNICFYPILKQLVSQNRLVYCIDTIGQGLSSRPDFNLEEPKEIIQYFNDNLELWRKQLNLQKFILVGHSIGGYQAANYAMQHPEYVANLHLISPIGSTYCDEEINKKYEEVRVQNMGWFMKRLYNNLIKPQWQKQCTPEKIGSATLMPLSYIISRYTKKRLNLKGEEQKNYYDYLYESYQMKSSSSKCLHKLFYFPKLGPYISLEEEMPQRYKENGVHFYFGDIDWMNSKGAYNIIQKDKSVKGSFHIITNSGHNVQFDNGKELILNILQNDKHLAKV